MGGLTYHSDKLLACTIYCFHFLNHTGVLVYHCLVSICESLLENEEKLNALDRNSGDGDTGTTFARAAKGIHIEY